MGFILSVHCMMYGQVKNILVLGDSHLKGYFGEFLHKKLHETGKYDVLSIGIGGAGSKNFVLPLQNVCCGYKVRLTCAGDSISEKKSIPYIEKAESSTKGIILKRFGGRLSHVLEIWRPDAVIIALGSNYVNAHDELISILEDYNPDLFYVWVGPFKRRNVAIRYAAIEKTIRENPQGILIRSDDIIGHDTLSSAHFTGASARRWAYEVMNRFEPILTDRLYTPAK